MSSAAGAAAGGAAPVAAGVAAPVGDARPVGDAPAPAAARHANALGSVLAGFVPERAEAAAAVASAAVLAVAGRPWGPWWAALVAAAPLWPALVRAPARRAWLVAAIALAPVPAIGYEGLRVYDPGAWWAVTAAVAAGYGIAGAAAAAAWARWRRSAGAAWRPLPWLLAWAAIDLIASHARPWPLPFPVTPGYALVGGPLVALAAWAGPAGLGVAWGVLGVAVATFLPGGLGLRGARGAWPWTAAVLVVAAASASGARAPGAATDPLAVPGAASVRVAVTQRPSAPEGERLAAYLAAARGAPAVEVHVWPEAALGRELAANPAPLQEVARELGGAVLAGAFRLDEAGGWRNAAALADETGARFVADKRWTIPGYEAWLTPGVGERWPAWAAGLRWGVLMCWESLFLDEAIARVRAGADALAVLAHDGWAAGTATPWWHARAGRLLAVAVGRPVIVASHDGPSMAWDPRGRAIAVGGGGDAVLAFDLPVVPAATTPYVRLGPEGLAVAWFGVAAAAVAAAGRRRQGCGASGPQAT